MGDGAEYLMQREIDLETGFAELEKRDFELQMSKRITKMVHELLRREKEPGDHPFYPKKRQEETYFKHKGQGGIIDIRTIDSDYAKNLYNWYIKHHDYDENILFMKTLKNKFKE